MRALLHTQPFIMLANIDAYAKIGKKARSLLENEESTLFLSSISLVEIAVKVSNQKLVFPQSVVDSLIDRLRINVIDFTRAAAKKLSEMPKHHNDPFDRMLIASALVAEMPIIGSDESFRRYGGLKLIW